MDLLEHYLSAVAAQLDKGQREDIVAELRDTLLNRFEEKEEALGRPLTDDEREAILREMGHPLVVAARYNKGPQHLMGPELFPWWMFAVKAGLMVLVALHVVQLFFGMFTVPEGFEDAVRHIVSDMIEGGLIWIGLATACAYAVERSGWRPGFMKDWRVKDLPVLKLSDPEAWRAVMTGDREKPQPAWSASKRPTRWPTGEAIFSMICLGVFIAWWTGTRTMPGEMTMPLSDGVARLVPAPVWDANFVPILLLAIGQLWIEMLRLMRPQWVRFIAGLQALAAAVGLAIVWVVFDAGHWFTLVEGSTALPVAGDWIQLDMDRLRALQGRERDLIGTSSTLSLILSWVFVGVMISLVLSIVNFLWRLVRGAR